MKYTRTGLTAYPVRVYYIGVCNTRLPRLKAAEIQGFSYVFF